MKPTNAHNVTCPLCGAPPGRNCRSHGQDIGPSISHTLRAYVAMLGPEEAPQYPDDENEAFLGGFASP